MISRDKIAGSLYGLALGDALGLPTEFMNLKSIYKMFGRSGRMELPSPANFTDDTQMTLRVAFALYRAQKLRARNVADALRIEFIDWAQRDPRRAPGITCLTAISRMNKQGMSWSDASIVASKGCGANMRVAPTAFIRSENVALNAASLQAAMTHGHPTAIAATELTALAIRWSAQGMAPHKLVERLLGHAVTRARSANAGYRREWLGNLANNWPGSDATRGMRHGWQDCINSLLDLQSLLAKPVISHPADICKPLGNGGWVADEALVLGLYFAIRYCGDPVLAISEAARTSGDSDSIASIAGAIIGAYIGENAWPESWRNRIERRSDIEVAIAITSAVS